MTTTIHVDPSRSVGRRDPRIYGQFIEHFHRQIYGGVFEPGSPLADGDGFRTDVIEAISAISPGILRWPGGCFVSAYHWKDGVGNERRPHFDKAWQVEESNAFGTDEFIAFCRKIDAQPYICTNAGTGTPEEMSDWVEYCNLENQGTYAKQRIANGRREPFVVPIWSIGNENYGTWEMGAKSAHEWGRFVLESAKMMKAVDPTIELSAASITDLDWNLTLLREAGDFLDWVSIHRYWDMIHSTNALSPYEQCMVWSAEAGEDIEQIEHVLGALGYLGRIRIAFDEWNLRGWYHPKEDLPIPARVAARDDNDLNASYTMADAVFSACFLNETLRHCNTVKMANFAPVVNTRGLIYTHPEGIVLRSTYHVFALYTQHLGETVVDAWLENVPSFEVQTDDQTRAVPAVDSVATTDAAGDLRIALVNRHPDESRRVELTLANGAHATSGSLHSIAPPSKDSYNDVDRPETVCITSREITSAGGSAAAGDHASSLNASAGAARSSVVAIELPPHSVHVLHLPRQR